MTRIVVRKNVSVRSETKICTADGERAVEDVANEPIMDQNVSRSIVKGMTRTQSIHTLTGDKPLESSVAMTVSYHGLVGRQVRKVSCDNTGTQKLLINLLTPCFSTLPATAGLRVA